jgi:thiamine-monophosphate kinase
MIIENVVMFLDLRQIGEFGLIDLIKQDTLVQPDNVVIGIGDDAAVLCPSPHHLQLFTTDMLVENVHFDLQTMSPWQLGYKAMAVNFSDIAAMGGEPKHAVISLAPTEHTSLEFIVSLYEGMKTICREYRVNIVGGDTVSSPSGLIINVAVLGEVEPERLVRRSGAQVGDLILVTGTLGNSSAGLDVLTHGVKDRYEFTGRLVAAHLTPRPQVAAAREIGCYGPSSMDDISDGLASEANEIAAASKVGMKLYAGQIPLLTELRQAAVTFNKPALDYALYGGEDFQLLFTMSPERFSKLPARVAAVDLTVIGEVVDAAAGVLLVSECGQTAVLEPKGYNHFR